MSDGETRRKERWVEEGWLPVSDPATAKKSGAKAFS